MGNADALVVLTALSRSRLVSKAQGWHQFEAGLFFVGFAGLLSGDGLLVDGDDVGAGVGELVAVEDVEGEAPEPLPLAAGAVDGVVVGVVDVDSDADLLSASAAFL